ncbi:MAG: 16S rRNA (cytosine(1402)-N(4))-methyltransferase, partial [Pseudomonadota bacterium]|nr:16S rRNA (cytosine(1402)-N(4))-methyltransferase [Pseudomonadota bacterium]
AKAPPADRRRPELQAFVPVLKAIGAAQKAVGDETAGNPRARSAVLRVAEKLQVPPTHDHAEAA